MQDTKKGSLEKVNTIIAAVGVVGALAGGLLAYFDFRHRVEMEAISAKDAADSAEKAAKDSANLQALEPLQRARLDLCLEVSEAAAALVHAPDAPGFRRAFERFAQLKHGKALVLLDQPTVDEMVVLYNMATELYGAPDAAQRAVEQVGNEPFKVSLACRRFLANKWSVEGGESAFEQLNEHVVMAWAKPGRSPSKPQ